MRIHVEIEGLDGQLKRLEALDEGLKDHAPFLKEAGLVLVESSQRNFEEGGRPKWAPLSWATLLLRSKDKAGYREHKRGLNKGRITKKTFETFILGARPLRDTGILMASIGNTAGGGVYRLEKNSITVGTALRQARPLHEGVKSTKGIIKGKTIPPRPFMGATEEDRQRIYDMAVVFVEKRIKESGA